MLAGATTRRRALLALAGAVIAAAAIPAPAAATFPGENGPIVFRSGNRVVLIHPDGSGRRTLVKGELGVRDPSIAADGRTVAFGLVKPGGAPLHGWENVDVHTLGIDGAGARQLTGGAAAKREPAFFPDGRIAYISDCCGGTRLFTMNPDGTDQRSLLPEGDLASGVDVSPDGERVAFAGRLPGQSPSNGIFITSSTGTGTRVLAYEEKAAEPSFSPDGGEILFTSDRSGRRELWRVRPDGTGLEQVTSNRLYEEHPVYSPDGTRIAFDAYRPHGARPQLYVMDADGTHARRLTRGRFDTDPDWGPAVESAG